MKLFRVSYSINGHRVHIWPDLITVVFLGVINAINVISWAATYNKLLQYSKYRWT
jgi:hypothetical protein